MKIIEEQMFSKKNVHFRRKLLVLDFPLPMHEDTTPIHALIHGFNTYTREFTYTVSKLPAYTSLCMCAKDELCPHVA